MNFEVSNWISLVSILFIIFCFYFTLTFIENIKEGDQRIITQSKVSAIVCLSIALLLPLLFSLVF